MTFLSDLIKNIDVTTVQQLASKNFNKCQFKDCTKFSLGFQCVGCNTFVCNDHLYFKLATPPLPVCILCVLEKHGSLGGDDA